MGNAKRSVEMEQNMMDVKEFQEKLVQLMTVANEQDKNLAHEDILKIFGENQLSVEQLQSLYDYLRLQGIRIQGMELPKQSFEESTETDGKETKEEKKEEPMDAEAQAAYQEYVDYKKNLAKEKDGEREALLKEYRLGNKKVQERLLQLYMKDILVFAKSLYKKGIYVEDLIQEGNMSFLMIIPEEIPETNADGWVKTQILSGMNDWLMEQTEQKIQDEYMVEKVRKLEAAIKELADGEDQKFSIDELSAFLEMDVEEIQAILSLTGEGEEA